MVREGVEGEVDVSGPHLMDSVLTRRDALKLAAGIGATLGLGSLVSACGESNDDSSYSPATALSSVASEPTKGGHVRSGITGGSTNDDLDVHFRTSEPEIAMSYQLYESLLGWDEQHNLIKQLVESYEHNADGSEHTVRLKAGLEFHSGKTVTSDDVIWTYERILSPKTFANGRELLRGLRPGSVKKLDDRTVRFVLEEPNAVFHEGLATINNAIVPVGFEPKDAAGAIGTGPWIVERFDPGQQAELRANPNYWGEGPNADRLTLVCFADPTSRLNALLGGTVDHIGYVDGAQAKVVKSTAGLTLLQAKSGGWRPFTMRVDQPPFDDERVRQAFRLIVDREQMIDQALSGYGSPGNDMYGVFDPGYPGDLPQRVQDLEQAKSLLEQAGQQGLSVELVTSTGVGPGMVAAAQVFAEQAKGAGVTVKVNQVDPSIMWGESYLKWTFAQDYWPTHDYLAQAAFCSLPSARLNETHWRDAEWLGIVNEAFRTVDETRRNELVGAAAQIEYERGGLLIWEWDTALDGHSNHLSGVVPDVDGLSACRYRYNLMYFTA